jgi:cytochrome bd ubiquinol oxidase subunit I
VAKRAAGALVFRYHGGDRMCHAGDRGFGGLDLVADSPVPDNKWLLRGLVGCSPLGFIAVETGWFVTELGRQPWIIYGVMRTRDAVTPMPGLVVPFTTFTLVYLLLAVIVIFLLRRQFMETRPEWIKRAPVLQH